MDEQTCDTGRQDVHLSVRIPRHLKDALAVQAEAEDRSLSNYVKRLIVDHLADDPNLLTPEQLLRILAPHDDEVRS